jgi:hypothetical protein
MGPLRVNYTLLLCYVPAFQHSGSSVVRRERDRGCLELLKSFDYTVYNSEHMVVRSAYIT